MTISNLKATTIIDRAIKMSYFLAIFSWFFWILCCILVDNPEGQLKYIFLFIADIICYNLHIFGIKLIEKEPQWFNMAV